MSSHSYFDPNWTSKVTVPVKRVGERWEFFYGGDVPVREGTLGELTISAEQITDERFQRRVSQETVVKILEEGALLLVALSDRSTNRARVGPWPEISPEDVPAGTTRFEAVTIGPAARPSKEQDSVDSNGLQGGLWLRLKGLERSELACSTVVMPKEFHEPTAISLNHALTMLSRAHEMHRISNTGNVYDRVFYQESNGRWYPLADLRRGVQAQTERELIADVWKQVENALGWRPVPPEPRRKKR
jgi:hypothetical protein